MTLRVVPALLVAVLLAACSSDPGGAEPAAPPSDRSPGVAAPPVQADPTSPAACTAVLRLEQATDRLDGDSLAEWEAQVAEVRRALAEVEEQRDPLLAGTVEQVQARLSDVEAAVQEARVDPISGRLALADTASELVAIGDQLRAETGC